MSSNTTSCCLDPLPTWLFKECLDELVPVYTAIVNLSLSLGIMPTDLKEAILIPYLKKLNIDPEILKHFRPVSNLTFLSKIVEKVSASDVQAYMTKEPLHELMQSAYKEYHSTETALVKVHNDASLALDKHHIFLLVLIDLSAAFDTVDHSMLLEALHDQLGIEGVALDWFRSYLADRTQYVYIDGVRSDTHKLRFGVPQGSVLGGFLFTIYFQPISDIARRHGFLIHIYADDSQIYISFEPIHQLAIEEGMSKLESCVSDLLQWMKLKMLKCNEDKTEFLVIYSKYRSKIEVPRLRVGDDLIIPSESARNLGVIFDKNFTFEKQISAIVQGSYFQLRRIGKIRRELTQEAALDLVQSLVINRLDYCNALLVGLPNNQICSLSIMTFFLFFLSPPFVLDLC